MVTLRVVEGNDFLALLLKLFGPLPDEEFDLKLSQKQKYGQYCPVKG